MADDIKCPMCGCPTLLRCAKKGPNAGRAFYVCTQYPDCRGRIPVVVDSEVIKHFNEAEHLLESQEFGKAIIEFTKVINLDPTLETPYIYRAVCHVNLEHHQEAVNDYDKAIQINPHNPLSYIGRHKANMGLSENQQAIEDINKAIQLTHEKVILAEAYLYRGNIYSKLEEYDLAIQDYNKSISLDPDERTAYFNRSSAYDALGEHDKAREDLDIIVELATAEDQTTDKMLNKLGEELSNILPILEKDNPKLYAQTRNRVRSNPNDNPTLARELLRYEAKKGKKEM
jgi:tetratricopeptide (TPR) repeat protein